MTGGILPETPRLLCAKGTRLGSGIKGVESGPRPSSLRDARHTGFLTALAVSVIGCIRRRL
jgi:hypothetical protein